MRSGDEIGGVSTRYRPLLPGRCVRSAVVLAVSLLAFVYAFGAPAGAITLGEAVDTTSLVWTTGGNAPWSGISGGSDGDWARSGTLAGGQSSWLETTVQGPGFLEFDWRVLCVENREINLVPTYANTEAGYLVVFANDVPMGIISADSGVRHKSLLLPDATSYRVRWKYYRAYNQWHALPEPDGAWLDRVNLTGTYPLDSPVLGGLAFTTGEEPDGHSISVIFGEFISEITYKGQGGWYAAYPVPGSGTGPFLTSAPMDHGQRAWLNATVRGAGSLEFDWLVDSEAGFDFLTLFVDDQQIDRISGQPGAWAHVQVPVTGDRDHAVSWRYMKDGGVVAGADRGSVKNVQFVTGTSAPDAQFSANRTSGTAPLTVQFTDTSTGSPTSWAWTFGDGVTSTLRHPVHVYASPGTYTVSLTVRNGAGQSDTETRTGMITVSPPPLTVTSISPNSGVQGSTVAITNLGGTGFASPATVKLTRTGSTDILATSVAVVSPTQITCQLALPATAATGQWNVVVSSGGQTTTLASGFTVSPPALSVSSITPSSGTQGTTVAITNLAGTGFTSPSTVKLTRAGSTDIVATSVVVATSTKITCSFALPATAAAGQWNVVVTSGGQTATLANGFTIAAPSPTIASIVPSSGIQGTTVAITNLAGTGFLSGATVKLTRSGSTDIVATNVVVVSPTKITCSFALPATAAPGTWNVVVSSGGQTTILASGFTVNPPALSVSSITPTSGTQGTTVAITNLAGTGFTSPATVKLTRAGSADISATSVSVVSPTKITCSLAVPATAATGTWNVVVTSGGQTATFPNGFTVASAGGAAFRFVPASILPAVGGTSTTTLFLDDLAEGMAGYEITLSLVDPTVGEIVAATVPDTWMTSISALPADSVTLMAADLAGDVGPGADARIGTVTVRGDRQGQAQLQLTAVWVDSDTGGTVSPRLATCPVIVGESAVVAVPPGASLPTDTDGDGVFDDVNGNGRADFADVVLYFNQMSWIAGNEPVALFDYNGNGRIDFADVVWLFNNL